MNFEVIINDVFDVLKTDDSFLPTDNKFVLGLINDFQEGEWRFEKFQKFIWNNIKETALSLNERRSPLYRLKKATGREHNSLANLTENDFANNIIRPEDGQNMRNFTQEYQYDEIGNLLQMKSNGVWTRDYRYDFATNNYLLDYDLQGTTNIYEYDAHGNMTKMPHLPEMKYDYADQLNEVTLNLDGNKAYYVYNANGERVRKVVVKNTGTIVEDRFYVGDYEIYSKKTNGTLDVERETLHIIDDKQKVALIDYDTQNLTTTVRYQYTNHLDSASLELDETGDIISYEEYHPFGTTSYRSGRNEIDVSLKRYKYVHKELDNETGLIYYGLRFYAPWIARFISVDPLQFKYPELTPFQYASNAPISNVDLDGAEKFPNKYLEHDPTKTVPQDNTKIITNNINFNYSKKTEKRKEIVIPKEKKSYFNQYTSSNPEMIRKMTQIQKNREQVAENLEFAKEVNPFMYGGGDFGFGFFETTKEAFKQAPAVVIPEMMIGHLQKISKMKKAYDLATKTKITEKLTKIKGVTAADNCPNTALNVCRALGGTDDVAFSIQGMKFFRQLEKTIGLKFKGMSGWKHMKPFTSGSIKSFLKTLPDDSFGIVYMETQAGSAKAGHFFNYYVTDKTVHFIDMTQKGNKFFRSSESLINLGDKFYYMDLTNVAKQLPSWVKY